MQAAFCLFHEHGFKGVSMDDIASKARLKKANLFHYYPSKDELGLAVLERACESEKACITETLSGDGDPIKTVEGMFSESAARMKKGGCHKGCFIGNIAQEISDENEKMRVRISDHLGFWTGELAAYLARAKAEGYFRKGFEPVSAAQAIISLLEGATLMSKATKKSDALTNAGAVAAGYLKAQRG